MCLMGETGFGDFRCCKLCGWFAVCLRFPVLLVLAASLSQGHGLEGKEAKQHLTESNLDSEN